MRISRLIDHLASRLPYLLFTLLGIELIILILCHQGVLALGYGWEGRMYRHTVAAVLACQVIFWMLASRVKDPEQGRSLIGGQLILAVVVLIWIAMTVEVDYRMT